MIQMKLMNVFISIEVIKSESFLRNFLHISRMTHKYLCFFSMTLFLLAAYECQCQARSILLPEASSTEGSRYFLRSNGDLHGEPSAASKKCKPYWYRCLMLALFFLDVKKSCKTCSCVAYWLKFV